MSQKAFLLSAAAIAMSLTTAYGTQEDVPFQTAPRTQFNLNANKTNQTYFNFVRSTLGPALLAKQSRSKNYDGDLQKCQGGAACNGIGVQLSTSVFNLHLDYPRSSVGGRSYGWTSSTKLIGDWSDAVYLTNLWAVVSGTSPADLAKFYSAIIQVLGSSNGDGLEALQTSSKGANSSQRLAANFIAIYTAEEYRALPRLPDAHENWDDALLEVTMLGAFHGGQSTFTKFYRGQFSTKAWVRKAGVYGYRNDQWQPPQVPTTPKTADMTDYTQDSYQVGSEQSGPHETRQDYEAMGTAITTYEAKNNANLVNSVRSSVGSVTGGKNVIKDISQYFTSGKADASKTDALAQAVSTLMLQINKDANDITNELNKK